MVGPALCVVLSVLFVPAAHASEVRGIARIADRAITDVDIRRHLDGPATPTRLRAALQAAVDAALLRAEAQRLLGLHLASQNRSDLQAIEHLSTAIAMMDDQTPPEIT